MMADPWRTFRGQNWQHPSDGSLDQEDLDLEAAQAAIEGVPLVYSFRRKANIPESHLEEGEVYKYLDTEFSKVKVHRK